jgi:hypothetical protein
MNVKCEESATGNEIHTCFNNAVKINNLCIKSCNEDDYLNESTEYCTNIYVYCK